MRCPCRSYLVHFIFGLGCQPCDCNGHGNKSQGECDIVTGECICTDNTMGLACENCMDGYYGDPR